MCELDGNLIVGNLGSSSTKFAKFDMATGEKIDALSVDGIGGISNVCHGIGDSKIKYREQIRDHKEAREYLFGERCQFSINDTSAAVLRVVFGGDHKGPTLVTPEVLNIIRDGCARAPSHNPPTLALIEAIMNKHPRMPIFSHADNAFHRTIARGNRILTIPNRYIEDHLKIGYHGISYEYLTARLAEILKISLSETNAIAVQAGSGVSLCAIRGGDSLNTTMGETTNSGPLMRTRSGNSELGVILDIMEGENISPNNMRKILESGSGLAGMTIDTSGDFRELQPLYEEGRPDVVDAVDLFIQQLADQIFAYLGQLEGNIHAIILSGGIMENSAFARKLLMKKFKWLGISQKEGDISWTDGYSIISTDNSKYKVLVIRTQEEEWMAKQALKVIKSMK